MEKLCDICDFQGGSQPPKNEWSFEPKAGYIRMLQIRDFTQSEKVTPEYIKISSSIKQCMEDDILIARYGASIGKILTGLAGAYNVAIMKTIPDTSKIRKKYLYYYLKSPYFQNSILNVGSRAAQAGFNKEDLSKLVIECPAFSKQDKIIDILSKLEAVIEEERQQLMQLDTLIKSRFIEMFGDPLQPAKSKPLGDMALLERGKFSPRPRNDPQYYNGVYPFVQTGDVANCNHRLVSYHQTLNEKGIKVSKCFPSGTILIALVGATIGATAILEST